MKKIGASSSHLFLIELIIIILFFAFASTISLQVFGKAYRLSENTGALNGGIMAAQTAAETDKGTPLNELDFKDTATYYDKEWQTTDVSNADYTLASDIRLEKRPAGTMASFHYTVYSGTEERNIVFELDAKKYYSGESIPVGYEERGADHE